MNQSLFANLMSNLQLTNSLSRKKELFKPINPNKFHYMLVGQLFMIAHMLAMLEVL